MWNGWQNQNPVIYPSIVWCMYVYWVIRKSANNKYRARLREKYMLAICSFVFGAFYFLYEIYYNIYLCRVSEEYLHTEIMLAHSVSNMLRRAKIEHWIDFASLLAILRGHNLNDWEYDVDISIVHPAGSTRGQSQFSIHDPRFNFHASENTEAYTNTLQGNQDYNRGLRQFRQLFHDQGFPTRWDPSMDLLQVFASQDMYDKVIELRKELPVLTTSITTEMNTKTNRDAAWLELINKAANEKDHVIKRVIEDPDKPLDLGIGKTDGRDTPNPHIDIWLWIPAIDENGHELLTTADTATSYGYRHKSEIFPLTSTKWLGRQYTIARDSETISDKEYSKAFGVSYKKPACFRGDCFHNFFTGRWRWSLPGTWPRYEFIKHEEEITETLINTH